MPPARTPPSPWPPRPSTSWGTTTQERGELLALADAIEASLDDLKQIEVANVGKPVSIIDFEFDLTVDNLRFFAGAKRRTLQARITGEYLEGYTSMLRRDPLGVCVGIAPWNYRSTWRHGSWARRWPPATPSSSSPRSSPLTALRLAEDLGRHLPARCLQRGVRAGRAGGRRLRAPPGSGDGVAHRRRRDRQADRPQGRRLAQAGPPRAGRQGAGAGFRRRRRGGAGRLPGGERLLQHRPGLHRPVPAWSPDRASTTSCSATWATPSAA